MIIRPATPDDAAQIAAIFHNTIHTVNRNDYTTEQLNAWSPRQPDPAEWVARKFGQRTTLVADQDGRVAGFAELAAEGYIDCFYCHQDFQRQGVGSALLAEIERMAVEQGVARLWAEVSITARPFFAARGFATIREQSVTVRSIQLTNFVMEKPLGIEE